MIGNDVIDLKLAARQSNWQRRGFLEKLFVSTEIQTILSAENPFEKVWELWSRKESVWKIINRETGIRKFNPKDFVCLADMVSYGQRTFSIQSEICEEKIHTIAIENPPGFYQMQICSKSDIFKKNDLPFIKIGASEIPASVSNHGRFEYCVYLNPFSSGNGTMSVSSSTTPNS